MSAMFPPIIVVLFTAINFNAADHVDGSQMRRLHSMSECVKLKATYDQGMQEVNGQLPPAFRIRWSADCRTIIVNWRAARND